MIWARIKTKGCLVYNYSIIRLIRRVSNRVKYSTMIDPGTVILTNNSNPELNGSYGRFNHASICLSDTKIIESLESLGVVINLLSDLINHPETGEYIYLIPKDKRIGASAARAAYELAGTPYRVWSSMFPRISGKNVKAGINCINLVNLAYLKALRYNPAWRVPDDAMNSKIFTHSEIHSNV